LANLAINRACDVEPPGHVQKRVRYGRQGVAIRRDQANQVRRIGFGQRNPDATRPIKCDASGSVSGIPTSPSFGSNRKVYGTTLDQ